jgi:pimeloyl-ACP methyl ester carboxylesterase
VTIAHEVTGTGPAVLLLHAGVCDRRMWEPQWPVLANAGYQVIRCDFRGFGDTPPADGPASDVDDVVDLMDALGLGRAALVGSSYGGRVAIEVAARWPDRVSALLLLCAALPGHQPSAELEAFWEQEAALLDAGDVAAAVELNVATWLGPEASEAVRADVRKMQRRAFDLQLAVTPPEDAVAAPGADEAGAAGADEAAPGLDLSAVSAPCLALSGGHDLPDFRQIAASLPGLLADARHRELPWAGHLPSLERPADVTPLLTGFLAERFPAAR